VDLLLRFKGGFGVDSGPNPYCQDAIIMVSQDVAEKSGRFETDFVVNVTVPPGSMQRFLRPTCDEAGNPLGDWYCNETDKAENPRGDWYFDGSPLGAWYFDAASALAEWAEANYPLNWELGVTNCQLNYPLNWELGVASDLTDSELAEQARLDELYDARLAELELYEEARLAEMQLADWEEAVHLAELYEASLAELELAEANWEAPTNSELYEDDHLADMHEEVRLDALDEEAYWVENQLAEATWAEDAPFSKLADWQVYLAELNEKGRLAELHEADQLSWALEAVKWEEEVRLDEWNSEFNPLRWVEEARLAELELAEEARLAEMQLELAVKDHLLEMQLAEAKWAEETSAAEWAEEARLADWGKEGYRWD